LHTGAVASFAGAFVFAAVCSLLPVWRARTLLHIVRSLPGPAPAVSSARDGVGRQIVSGRGADGGHTAVRVGGSPGLLDDVEPSFDAKNDAANSSLSSGKGPAQLLIDPSPSARSSSAASKPGLSRERRFGRLLRNAIQQHWLFPTDVEVMTRLALVKAKQVCEDAELHESVDMRRSSSGICCSQTSILSVSSAEEALKAEVAKVEEIFHAVSMSDVFGMESVVLSLTMASFYTHVKEDAFRAFQLLQTASRVPSTPDMSFLVYKRLQDWHHMQQRANVGSNAVDSLSLIQFRKYFSEAKRAHNLCVTQLNALFSLLLQQRQEKIQLGIEDEEDSDVAAHQVILGGVASFTAERRRAVATYKLALEKFPTSAQLLQMYGLFLQHVMNAQSSSQSVFARVLELADAGEGTVGGPGTSTVSGGDSFQAESTLDPRRKANGAESVNGSSLNGSERSGASSSASLAELVLTSRDSVARTELTVTKLYMRWFQGALLCVLALAVTMYVSTRAQLTSFEKSLTSMDQAGLRRKLTSSSHYYARGMQIAALLSDTVTISALRHGMTGELGKLSEIHANLYVNGQDFAGIDRMYKEATIPLRQPLPGQLDNKTHLFGLWDAGNLLVSNAMQVVQSSDAQVASAYASPPWSFIVWNARDVVLPAFDAAVELYEAFDRESAENAGILQASLVAIGAIITVLTGAFIFVPIITIVDGSKASVVDVLDGIPLRAVAILSKRYKRLQVLYERMERQSSNDEDENATLDKLKKTQVSVSMQKSRRKRDSSGAMPDTARDDKPPMGSQSPSRRPSMVREASHDAELEDVLAEVTDSESDGEELQEAGRNLLSRTASGDSRGDSADAGQRRALGAATAEYSWPTDDDNAPEKDGDLDSAGLAVRLQPVHLDDDVRKVQGQHTGVEISDGVGLQPENSSFGEETNPLRAVSPAAEALPAAATTPSWEAAAKTSHSVHSSTQLSHPEITDERRASTSSTYQADGQVFAREKGGIAMRHHIPQSSLAASSIDTVATVTGSPASSLQLTDLAAAPTGDPSILTGGHGTAAASRGGPVLDVMPSLAESRESSMDSASQSALIASGEVFAGTPISSSGASALHRGSSAEALSYGSLESKTAPSSTTHAGQPPAIMVPGSRADCKGMPAGILRSRSGSPHRANGYVAGLPSGHRGGKAMPRSHTPELPPPTVRPFNSWNAEPQGMGKPTSSRFESWSSSHNSRGLSPSGGRQRTSSAASSRSLVQHKDSLRSGKVQEPPCCGKAGKVFSKYLGRHSQVRILVLTVVFGLCLMGAVYIGSFVITLQTFDRGSFGSAELNNAGKRRYLARETLNSVRELMVGDPAVGTVPEMADRLRQYMALYRRVHEGLRYGDEELHLPGSYKRYPPREELMHSTSGSVTAGTATTGGDGFEALRVQGLQDQLQHFWLLADSLLLQYADPTVPRVGLNSTALFANTAYTQLYELEGTFLGKGLESAVKLYRVEGSETIVELEGLNSSLFAINLTTMFGLYVLLHWLAVAQVDRQLQQREDVLMLLPKSMIRQTRRLRRYLKQQPKQNAISS